MVDKEKINELFTRGVGEFIDPDGLFRKKLESKIKGEYKKDIIIKLGADPTRPDLHLGHAVIFRKLKKLQELGCKIVFIVGDFTTLLGDPTGKSKLRPKVKIQEEINKTSLESIINSSSDEATTNIQEIKAPHLPTSEEIEKNMETYIQQIEKTGMLDISPKNFSWIRNSDWFLNTTDMVYGSDAKAIINVELNKNGVREKISVDINPNSFLGKTILFENNRMQTKIKPGEINIVTLRGLLWTLQHITHSRLIDRDMFQARIKNNEELYVHEMLYPVIQGIDSYEIAKVYGDCDLEVGGTDQTFNMLMGRDVMKANNMEPQAVLSFKLLEGTDGTEKMSKSLNNYVGITDEPNDMYGKIMSIPDSSIINYFELCTTTSLDEIEEIKKKLEDSSVNPKDIKMNLAKQIVEIYHGKEKASEAEKSFVNTFQKKEIPEEMEEIKASTGDTLSEILVKNKILSSKGEWRRLILSNSIHDLNKNKDITDVDLKITENLTLKIGKKRFVKILSS